MMLFEQGLNMCAKACGANSGWKVLRATHNMGIWRPYIHTYLCI